MLFFRSWFRGVKIIAGLFVYIFADVKVVFKIAKGRLGQIPGTHKGHPYGFVRFLS